MRPMARCNVTGGLPHPAVRLVAGASGGVVVALEEGRAAIPQSAPFPLLAHVRREYPL
jgi:hypothetical protein